MEVTELQANDELTDSFKNNSIIVFYASLPEFFPELQKWTKLCTLAWFCTALLYKRVVLVYLKFMWYSSLKRMAIMLPARRAIYVNLYIICGKWTS